MLLKPIQHSLRTPESGSNSSKINPKQTEGFQDRVGLYNLIFKGDFLGIRICGFLPSIGFHLLSTDSGEVGNYLEIFF